MGIVGYKGNRIDIECNQGLCVRINGAAITVVSNKDSTLFSTPFTYGEFTTPTDLARAVIDTQSALDFSEILVRGDTGAGTESVLDVRRNLADLSDDARSKFSNISLHTSSLWFAQKEVLHDYS